jgi:tetratricopeptide (TPR) repeat protein
MMQTLIANLRLWSGRLHEAETMASRALIGFREAGDRYGLMQALAPLTRVRAALGKAAEAERGSEELVSLGHSFGELGLALQGAAGVAVHLGDAERALVLTEQVLDRQRATGAATAEAMVLRSLALAQLGQIDAAIASIDTVEVTDFPFGQAARALVRSLAGDPAGSEDARTVLSGRSPTYFDRALALLAVAMAPADPVDPGRREQARQELRSLAHQVGDAAFIGVSDALAGAAPPSTSLGESPIRDGWQRMVAARLALG